MGNSMGGGRKKAKVMKVDGETFKLKTPIRVCDVVKDYPGHVLLDSEAVKHFGIRAKPLEPQQNLKPRKIYFLVELPKLPDEEKTVPRRARSGGIHMSAKERLECLMLSRRSVSDVSLVRPTPPAAGNGTGPAGDGRMTVKMRVPKSEMAKLVEESQDASEVAGKILEMYIENGGGSGDAQNQMDATWKSGLASSGENFTSKREISEVKFVKIPRESNELADRLAKSAAAVMDVS